jgi:uncharacterized 2Fe-2S/4Fe-4S cluster protein (DUF4445 family)
MEAIPLGKATVIFQPSGHRGLISKGLTLMDAARDLGDELETLCGGKGVCGKCRIHVADGAFPKFGIVSSPSHLSPWQDVESRFLSETERKEGFRLACCARIQGDVLIFIPESSRAGKQVVSKKARLMTVDFDPVVKKYELEVPLPNAEDGRGDYDRLIRELSRHAGLQDKVNGISRVNAIDIDVLRVLPRRLRENNGLVTVSVWMNDDIIRVRAGRHPDLFGIAVDIGTTTVVASLVHLNAKRILATRDAMNPQVKYGEDVISRINFHMKSPRGLQQMSQSIIATLNDLITDLLRSTWPSQPETTAAEKADNAAVETPHNALCLQAEDIEDMVIVCNTVMHHILLQLNPTYLARSPFPPVIQKSLCVKAKELGLTICPSAYVHLLPNEAAFVGADNVGVLIAEAPYHSDQIQLIIDIGTNGEILLGNRKRLLSAACATGPAFEGAEISFGMRAAPGAIERIFIDPETHEVAYKVVGNETWSNYAVPGELRTTGICGSGILDLLAELFRTGVVLKSGVFHHCQKSRRFRVRPDTGVKEFVIAWARETAVGKDITITQRDIRQIQLAKAAIYAGCKLLLEKWGIDRVDVVKIAGGFGIHVDPVKILIMGMIPDIDPKHIIPIGNAAGTGAIGALVSAEKRAEADWIARKVENIELSTQKNFKEQFIKALALPHAEDPFPHLVDLVPPDILYP